MDATTVIGRRGTATFTRLDDELIALDPQAGVCLSLNASAARVWELIESPASIESIRRQLMTEFEVDEATCARDIGDILRRLQELDLVEVQAGAG
jgi:hypothetical protein